MKTADLYENLIGQAVSLSPPGILLRSLRSLREIFLFVYGWKDNGEEFRLLDNIRYSQLFSAFFRTLGIDRLD